MPNVPGLKDYTEAADRVMAFGLGGLMAMPCCLVVMAILKADHLSILIVSCMMLLCAVLVAGAERFARALWKFRVRRIMKRNAQRTEHPTQEQMDELRVEAELTQRVLEVDVDAMNAMDALHEEANGMNDEWIRGVPADALREITRRNIGDQRHLRVGVTIEINGQKYLITQIINNTATLAPVDEDGLRRDQITKHTVLLQGDYKIVGVEDGRLIRRPSGAHRTFVKEETNHNTRGGGNDAEIQEGQQQTPTDADQGGNFGQAVDQALGQADQADPGDPGGIGFPAAPF